MAFFTATATERLSGPTVGVFGENPAEGKCVPIPACISCCGKQIASVSSVSTEHEKSLKCLHWRID